MPPAFKERAMGDTLRRDEVPDRTLPLSAGTQFGLGLGGFFDGIVLHQVLQWHHMLTSAGFPASDLPSMRINTLADGLFNAAT